MSLTLNDIQQIEDYLLGQLSKRHQKQVEQKMEQDEHFASEVNRMKQVIAGIREKGRNDLMMQFAAIETSLRAGNELQAYHPGKGAGSGPGSNHWSRFFSAFTVMAVAMAGYFMVLPNPFNLEELPFPTSVDSLMQIIPEEANELLEEVQNETIIRRDTIRYIRRVITIDTVIQPGEEFDADQFEDQLKNGRLKGTKIDTVNQKPDTTFLPING